VVTCGKRVDGDVDVMVVSGGQLASVGRLCEATLSSDGSDVMRIGRVIEVAKTVCEYRAVDTTLQMPVWCESDSRIREGLCVVGKITLAECDVDKGACVVRGQGVETYVPSSAELRGDEHNKMQLMCVSSGGVPVPYVSATDVGLECVGDGGCVGECVGCEVVGSGVIEMVYRVEGTGDLQLTVRLFGEVVLVSLTLICAGKMGKCVFYALHECVYVR